MPKQYSAERRREYQAAYRAAGREKSRVAGQNRIQEFRGFDGEGGTADDSDYHAYFLLTAGESSIFPSAGNIRLSTRECLSFLADLPRDSTNVVYFGDYDVTKMLEDISFDKLNRLMNRSLRARKDYGTWPLDWEDFELDYLPRKEFKVRRKGTEHWTVINDVGSFFQCRFVEALEKWDIGTPEERALIGAGKERRNNFTWKDIDEILPYNQLEIRLLEQLMVRFRAACIDVGIVPAKWQGPGQLAEALFKKYSVPPSKDVPILRDPAYAGLMDFGRKAFYGGRPELSVVGPVTEPCFQWDINSAYPHAMEYVPCLEHGRWIHETERFDGVPLTLGIDDVKERGSVALCFGSFAPVADDDGSKPPLFYGFPFRSESGTITYPAYGRGWYWSFEAAESIHQTFDVEEAWIYVRDCECSPLAFTRDIYVERNRIGKDGPGIVLKLALNSLYGKTAQSVGYPKYSNPIWASFITAFCRAMIQRFIHSSEWCRERGWCGRDVQMIATDSVCTTTRRTDITPSKALGGWSVETHSEGIFFVQPGVYFGSSGKPAKTRGVPRDAMETMRPDFESAFAAMVSTRDFRDGDVRVPQRMFVGIRYALHRRNTKLLGQWIEFTDPDTGKSGKKISFEWLSKRSAYPVLSPVPGIQPYILTFPHDGDASVCTVPYSKDIGGIQAAETVRLLFEAQPDWADDLTTGSVL